MRKITLKHSLPARLEKHFSEELNDSQRQAVMAPDGYNLILAGPGSGKTRVITYRVAYLIARGVPADRSCWSRSPAARRGRWCAGWRASSAAMPARSGPGRFTTSATGCSAGRPDCSVTSPTSRSWTARTSSTSSSWPWRTPAWSGKDKLAPKPAEVQHLISFALNTGQPLADVAAVQSPGLVEWLPRSRASPPPTPSASWPPTAWIMTTCSTQWLRLLARVSRAARAPGEACSGTS